MNNNEDNHNYGFCPLFSLLKQNLELCMGANCEFAIRNADEEEFFDCSLTYLAKQSKAINDNLKNIHSEVEDIANSLHR